MAGLKDTFSKGLTTINVKTSNFMEETKQKTFITTQEQEIEKLKMKLGVEVYNNWTVEGFTLDSLQSIVDEINSKYEAIEEAKKQIDNLAAKEQEILGASAVPTSAPAAGSVFCTACGAPNKAGHKFCEKCGNKLD